MREVSIGAWDGANWNQTFMIGHAGRGIWQHVSCQHQSPVCTGLPAVRAACWGVAGVTWLSSQRSYSSITGAALQGHWTWGSQGAPSLHPQPGPDWFYNTLTSREAAHKATLMVAASQSHASPFALPVTLAPRWPRAAHINATLISKGDDQPIMHSSLKI